MCLLTAIFAVSTVQAQSVSIWDGTSEIWTQGSGTESNPYLIQNAQQLAYIAEMVNGGVTHYDNTYFRLTTNVQIDSTNVWQPIGLNETYYFGGSFDGDNHIVTLYLNTSSVLYMGIFGYAKNGRFENLNCNGIVRCNQGGVGDKYVGGICGYSTSSFSNCNNTSNIFTSTAFLSYSGGICGYSTATITNCYNTGDISFFSSAAAASASYSGGICGYSTSTITNCHNSGNVSTSSSSPSSL